MNLQQMRYLVALADAGNLTAAARMLNVSQPALSQSIRNFEMELGVSLLKRSGRTLAFTDAGIAALTAIRRVLAAASDVKPAVAAYRAAPTLKIAVTHSLAPVLSKHFGRILKKRPDLRFRIENVAISSLGASVLEGKDDLGFGDISNVPPSLAVTRVGLAEIVLASAAGSNLPPTIPYRTLDNLSLVTTMPSPDRTEMFDTPLAIANVHPRIVVEIDDISAMVPTVQSGIGSMLAWRQMTDSLRDLEIRSFDPPLTHLVGFIHLHKPPELVIQFLKSLEGIKLL